MSSLFPTTMGLISAFITLSRLRATEMFIEVDHLSRFLYNGIYCIYPHLRNRKNFQESRAVVRSDCSQHENNITF